MTVLEILERGGWMMLPIYGCFLASLALALERLLVFRRAGSARPSEALEGLIDRLRRDGADSAGPLVGQLPPALRGIALTAVKLNGNPGERSRDRLVAAGQEQLHLLQQNMAVLATLAAVAPLLGFLGTVTGMIRAFMSVQAQGASVTPAVLAGGIWEALVTTGAGLAVGIIALVLHNLLAARIDNQAVLLGRSAELLLDAAEGR
ncbi:MAG: biopolymer transporter ExbB [Gemmatimonadetes bacterium]|nr:biopolymer transporter ExbB [Gemmatimonadota bacterium]